MFQQHTVKPDKRQNSLQMMRQILRTHVADITITKLEESVFYFKSNRLKETLHSLTQVLKLASKLTKLS